MSHIDKVVIGSRRRLLSDNFNDAERLSSRALLETISALALGDSYKLAAGGVGGVVAGFTVRAVVGTNEIEVQPGIALVESTPSSSLLDAPVEWVELKAATRVDLDSLVDVGNPRLVTIEVEANQSSKLDAAVDVFNPATGSFGIALQDTVTGSDPTLTATAGTASASPVVPAGTIGRIPLAVIKLATGQVGFTDQYASVLMCRPLLVKSARSYVAGGGLSLGEESGAAIVNKTDIYIHESKFSMLGLDADAYGPVTFSTGRTPDTTDPVTLAASVQPIYCYAVPPPWADDYGNIAPREAWAQNPNGVSPAAPGNIIGGDGSSFISLLSASGITSRSAIVIWDSVAPVGLDVSLGNASARVTDSRGPHPVTDGGGTITLDATQDPSWGATQVSRDTVYLGSFGSLASTNMAQAYKGRGYIRIIDEVDIGLGTGNRPILTTTIATGGALYPGRHPNMAVGDSEVIPSTSITVDLLSYFDATSPGGHVVRIESALGFGLPQSLFGSYMRRELDTAIFCDEHILISRDTSNAASFTVGKGAGALLVSIALTGYEDMILAAR